MKRSAAGIVLFLLLLTSSAAQYQPPHANPGPAVDRIRFRAFAVDIAPTALQNGLMDLYLFSLRTEAARGLLGKPGVRVIQAPATSIGIVLNPAPALRGELNPLSIPEVRSALQYIVNRDFVVSEIYKGLAVPMVAQMGPLDFDYLTISELIREANIRYDPDLGKKLVAEAMGKAGASLRDGQWFYNDKPIRLKFIIRVEDERRDVGDLVAVELGKLGFAVDRIYQTFGPAIFSVYGTDPRVFNWHLYTEGWGRGSPERYDFGTFNQMCAPWLGNMPGWQEVGFWQYENAQLDDVGQRLFTGRFADANERNELYRQGTKTCLKESIRLWVATVINSFPATSALQGVTLDLVGGPRSITTLREANIAGKSELTVGNLWVWTERTTWNPIGGFGDVYSVDIWRNLYDPPTWRHPFTGLPSSFRVSYAVETAGPKGKLTIPGDAFTWDAAANRWSTVPSGRAATSRVIFNYANYFGANWHHGQPIDLADVLYGIFQTFDLTYDASKSRIEFATAVVNKPYLDTFRGFRILNNTALEVYVDYWHFVPDYIAEYSSVASLSMPWEILAAMDTLVFEKRRAAYSDTAAQRFQVPWLSLVESRHATMLRLTLDEFLEQGFFPQDVFTVGDKLLLSKEQAAARYRAAIAWFKKYHILVISNGPFQLVRFDPPAQYAEIEAFRDARYPFKPGRWFLGEPPSIQFVKVEADFILIGQEARFSIEVQGPGEVGVKYLLFDSARGKVLKAGEAAKVGPTQFSITLPTEVTRLIEPGTYQILLTAYSDAVSVVSERVKLVEATTSPPTTKPPTAPPGGEVAPAPTFPTTIAIAAAVVAIASGFLFLVRRRVSKGAG